MVDRAGQLRAGRFFVYGISTPVRSTTIIVENNGGRFATNLHKGSEHEKINSCDRAHAYLRLKRLQPA